MQKLSKKFFLGSIAIGAGVSIILIVIGILKTRSYSPEEGLAFLGLVWIPLLYVAVVFSVLIYKMWAAIQDGHARTTPGKAIGFLFIPLFNIYWAFQAIWGFAQDYNRYIERHNIDTPPLPEGLFLAYVILCFTTWIPVIGTILLVINFFIFIMMVLKICDGVNALPDTVAAG